MELSSEKRDLKLSLIPAYLTILSTLDGEELSNALNHFLVALSISGTNIVSLRLAVLRLCCQPHLQENVLTGLWGGM